MTYAYTRKIGATEVRPHTKCFETSAEKNIMNKRSK